MITYKAPDDYHSLTVSLNLKGAADALAFYQRAFDAEKIFTWDGPDGKVIHGVLRIGDTLVMFCDEDPEWGAQSPTTIGGCPVSLNLYVADCDSAHEQATSAGAETVTPPKTYPWGERSSMIQDPYGFRWSLMQHLEDVSPEELAKRMETWEG
jgi:uncharacterized glyoxalase superfamily protein PhnB